MVLTQLSDKPHSQVQDIKLQHDVEIKLDEWISSAAAELKVEDWIENMTK
jgi:hypothetical protein